MCYCAISPDCPNGAACLLSLMWTEKDTCGLFLLLKLYVVNVETRQILFCSEKNLGEIVTASFTVVISFPSTPERDRRRWNRAHFSPPQGEDHGPEHGIKQQRMGASCLQAHEVLKMQLSKVRWRWIPSSRWWIIHCHYSLYAVSRWYVWVQGQRWSDRIKSLDNSQW